MQTRLSTYPQKLFTKINVKAIYFSNNDAGIEEKKLT